MIGGFQETEVTQEIRDLVANNVAGINSKLGSNATSFTIVKAFSQIVAGTNYFLHLTSNDGQNYSVCVYVPLPHTNAPAEVTLAEAGHTDPRNPN